MTEQEIVNLRIGDTVDYISDGKKLYAGVVLSTRKLGHPRIKWTGLISGNVFEVKHNDLAVDPQYVLVRQYKSVRLEEFI